MRVVSDTGTIELGTVEDAPTISIVDYSRRETDAFGVTTVVKRGFAHRMSVRLAVPFTDAPAVQQQLAALRATPATWIADDRFASLTVRGLYKDFELDHAVPPLSYCTLTVEGLAEDDSFVDDGIDPAPAGEVSTLKLLAPIAVTDAMLLKSSVAEDDAPVWVAGTTYAKGARVLVAATHRVYESLVDGNIGANPAAASAKWLDIGPTKRWAMFDQALGSVTAAATAIEVMVKPGVAVSGLAILDTTAASVRVRAGGYDRTIAVSDGASSALFLDLVAPAGTIIVVTVTPRGATAAPRQWDDGAAWDDGATWRDTLAGGDGTVEIGTLLVGQLRSLGVTEASPRSGITDYSRKDTDPFGEVTIVPRAWAKRMSAQGLIRSSAIDQVVGRIAAVRALPCLWIGDAALDSLVVYGFFKDVTVTVGESVSKLALSIEGLSTAGKVEPLKAGVNWDDVGDPNGTKPTDNADKTSENTAKDTAAVGGRPAADVVDAVDAIAITAIDTEDLKKARERLDQAVSDLTDRADVAQDAVKALDAAAADNAAGQRQLDDAVGRLSEATLRLLAISDRTQKTLRDAGIVVDPASGKVSIFAVDQLGARQNTTDITLNAQRAMIELRATSDEVDEKILKAVLDPSQVAELEPLIKRVSIVEQIQDALRSELKAKASLTELSNAVLRVTDVEQRMSAAEGLVVTKVDQDDFDGAMLRLGKAEQTLLSYGDISSYTVELRQVRASVAGANGNILAGLANAYDERNRTITAQATLRQELYTKIVDDVSAEARARLTLSVALGALDARSVQDRQLLIEADKVLAQDISGLRAQNEDQTADIASLQRAIVDGNGGVAGVETLIRQQIRGATSSDASILSGMVADHEGKQRAATSLAEIQTQLTTTLVAGFSASAAARLVLKAQIDAAAATFASEQTATADRFKAVSESLTTLSATLNDPTTGLASTRSAISKLETATAEALKSTTESIEALEAVVADPVTGLAKTRSELTDFRKLVADQDKATGKRIDQLVSEIDDPVTGLAKAHADVTDLAETVAEANKTSAEAIRQVTARLNGDGVTIEEKIAAVVEANQKILGTYTIAIDSKGNLVGTQLVGSTDGPGALRLINADLKMGTGRVIFDNGTFMLVQGVGFGAGKDLITWFGPSMAIGACSRANARSFEAIDGETYFGGTIRARSIETEQLARGASGRNVVWMTTADIVVPSTP